MISRRRLKILTAAVLLVMVITVCFAASLQSFKANREYNQNIQVLTIGTADSGGTMYPVGRAIAQILNEAVPTLKINISASRGSLSNVKGLQTGQVDMALVSADVAYSAYSGTGEFKNEQMAGLRAIGAVYLSYSNWLVKDTPGVVYVHDLLGKRVSVGPEDSTTGVSSLMALKVLGIDETNTRLQNYGLGSGSEALKQGTVDAVHGFAGIPIKSMADLADEQPCRLLLYTNEELDEILSANSQLIKTVIPAGTYKGQAENVETFGVKCLLCVSESMDEQLVYTVTKYLHQNIDELAQQKQKDSGFISKDLYIPLHPGAERYYKEAGLLK